MFTGWDETGEASSDSEEAGIKPQGLGSTQKAKPSLMPRTSPGEDLVAEEELLLAAGLSRRALKKLLKDRYIRPSGRSNGTTYYSREAVEHIKSMMCSVEARAVANLQEAHQVAQQGAREKARRSQKHKARASRVKFMDPRKIRTHPMLEGLLPIDEDLRQKITVDMRQHGYYLSEPIDLATWPGQRKPVVADGHTRRDAAIAAGIELIPCVISDFESEVAMLQYAILKQTRKRQTGDDVLFRLVECFDELKARGGDRRSKEVKSMPTHVGIEMGRSASAHRMAHLLGSNRGKVEKIRKILKDGTSEIIAAVKNGKIKINKAYNAIIKKGQAKEARTPIKLSRLELAAPEKLGGRIEDHVKAAVREYIERHREEESHTAEPAESADGEKE